MDGLAELNDALKRRGIRLTVQQVKEGLWLRGTLPQPDGTRKQQRVSLGLKAKAASLVMAEDRAVALAAAIDSGAYPSGGLPWVRVPEQHLTTTSTSGQIATVAEWGERLKEEFWVGRVRTSAAERTWRRYEWEIKRLPQQATLTRELLEGVAAQTTPGSRTRVEALKVFKRLGRLAGLEGLEQLDSLRTPYEPAERELPTDEVVLELVEAVRGHERWGWATAALVVYGCRPAEVFSLQPAADGTARVLSVKRKGKLPAWRTAMALMPHWAEQFEVAQVVRPWDCPSPAAYDSMHSAEMTKQWARWLAKRAEGVRLYDLRHAWAVRSIRAGVNASLAAKCMGHSLAVHHSTYHRWLDQSDVAAVAASLRFIAH